MPMLLNSIDVVNSKRNETHLTTTMQDNLTSSEGSISELIKDLGYYAMYNQDIFSKIIAQFPSINEQDVGQLIGMMSMNHTGLVPKTDINLFLTSINQPKVDIKESSSTHQWQLDTFVSVLKNKELNWRQVVSNLDYPGFKLKDQKGLAMIVTIYKRLTGGEKLPLDVIVCRKWNNNEAQLSFILLALDAPPDVIDFSSDKLRHVDMSFLSSQKNLSTTWGTIDLVESLLNLADAENINTIRKVLEQPTKHYPEQLLLALAQSKPSNVALQMELISYLVSLYVKPQKNSFLVLHKLFELNQPLLISSLVDTYRKDPTSLRRILDIAQELKALDIILDSRPFKFTIDLATLSYKRDHLNLELWLSKHIERYTNDFTQECINYLSERIALLKDPKQAASTPFTPDCARIFFKVLDTERAIISPEVLEQAYQIYQSLDDSLKKEIVSTEFQISPEIEEKTNKLFLSLFHGEVPVEVAIEKLKDLKLSKTKADQEMFACVIHNLFDEYRFFHQYPDEELKVMAKLFGLIIVNNIIIGKTLKYGLIYVLQALSNPNEVKLFQFGLIALSLFKTRIVEWPQFCFHLRNRIPQVQQIIPDLAIYITKGLEQQTSSEFIHTSPPPSSISPQPPTNVPTNLVPSQQVLPPTSVTPPPVNPIQTTTSVSGTISPPPHIVSTPKEEPVTPTKPKREETSASPGMGFQLDISTLTKGATLQDIEQPNEELADKLRFIVNNLSQMNINDKCNELKNVLTPNYYPFLARYIVINRASLEPNFHAVYAKFLTTLKLEDLNKQVLRQTYESIQALLKSERITTSLSERSLLKNLGSWLGLQTLAKNKPVLQKDLDIKALLFDAYEKGKLLAVIPFIGKILNHCAKSKVFAPPNPWVMGIVSLLVEIHSIPILKLNLKFEVEMLCKTLKLSITQVEQMNKEKGVVNLADKHQLQINNPDIHGTTVASGNVPVTSTEKLFNINQVSDTTSAITDLQEQVKISDSLTIFKEQPELRKLVVVAVDRTIREIIAPVVKRSVTIACRTTVDLVVKDFIVEPDWVKMQRASNLMVQSLASKLTMVTCKDPFKNSLQKHLKVLFIQAAIDPNDVKVQNHIDQIVQSVSSDNVNIGCSYIEQAARDKATMDITEILAPEIELRKTSQQTGSHWTNYALSVHAQRLPEPLVPKSGALHLAHLQVYEDFDKKILSEQPREDMLPSNVATDQIRQSFTKVIEQLDQIKKQYSSFLYVPATGEVTVQICKIRNTLKKSVQGNETAEAICQDLFSKLYETDVPITKEICVLIMKIVRDIESESAISQITKMWKELKANQKLEKETAISLVRADLLDLPTVDSELVSLMNDPTAAPQSLALLLTLIRNLVIQKNTISISDLPKCYSFLTNNLKNLPDAGTINLVIDQASKVSGSVSENPLTVLINCAADFEIQDRQHIREQLMKKFLQWIQLIDAPNNPAMLGNIDIRTINASLYKIIADQKEIILVNLREFCKSEKTFEETLVTLLEVTVEHFYKYGSSAMPLATNLFKFADAYSELIGALIFSDKQKNKLINRFSIVLKAITNFLIRDHELQQTNFNQRIYLRILSNILHQISVNLPQSPESNQNEEISLDMLLLFGDALLSLEPLKMPAFVLSWLELISHRLFMPKLLLSTNRKGWPKFHSLLISLFKFLEPYLRNIQLNNSIKLIYKTSLKILLVLLHDFSEFLCDNHFSLCDVIPSSCIQMRNLILSAFPRHMRLPDPFTPNLKVDLLPEITEPPNIQSDYLKNFTSEVTAEMLENYIRTRDTEIVNQIITKLKLTSQQEIEECGTSYNVPLINSVVLYTGILATRQARVPIFTTPATEILKRLVVDLDSEGRYLVLNAIANQLRYPNNHTHYFSCALLHLFLEMADKDNVQDQITRVLIERLIAHRPHPWGLLITFIELVKNSRYKFWDRPFIRCAPEIEVMFQNVRYTL
ncbi:hypothetical protein ABK040_001846 [Willaertia magna]